MSLIFQRIIRNLSSKPKTISRWTIKRRTTSAPILFPPMSRRVWLKRTSTLSIRLWSRQSRRGFLATSRDHRPGWKSIWLWKVSGKVSSSRIIWLRMLLLLEKAWVLAREYLKRSTLTRSFRALTLTSPSRWWGKTPINLQIFSIRERMNLPTRLTLNLNKNFLEVDSLVTKM